MNGTEQSQEAERLLAECQAQRQEFIEVDDLENLDDQRDIRMEAICTAQVHATLAVADALRHVAITLMNRSK